MSTAQKYAAVNLDKAQVAKVSQHSHQPVRSGALTILIVIVVLSLSVLSVLSISTARADLALSTRYMQSAVKAAELEAMAQEWLSEAAHAIKSSDNIKDVLLSNDAVVNEDNSIVTKIKGEGMYIDIKLDLVDNENGYEIAKWKLVKEWRADEGVDVWDGN